MLIVEVHTNNVLTVRDDTFANAVSDSVKHETVKFIFPDSWNEFSKTAVFSAEGVEPLNIILNSENDLCVSENECYIPFEVLTKNSFLLSVYGEKGERLATTTRVRIEVLESGYALGDTPQIPTTSEHSQIIEIMNLAKGETGDAGVYYGTEEPLDSSHPIWVNPEGSEYGDTIRVATEIADGVARQIVNDTAKNIANSIVDAVFGTSYQLEVTTQAGANWTVSDCSVWLAGNILRCSFVAKRTTQSGAGNISNEDVLTMTLKHDGKIKGTFATMFTGTLSSEIGTFIANGGIVDDTYASITIILTATHTNISAADSYFTIPVVLNVENYNLTTGEVENV